MEDVQGRVLKRSGRVLEWWKQVVVNLLEQSESFNLERKFDQVPKRDLIIKLGTKEKKLWAGTNWSLQWSNNSGSLRMVKYILILQIS